MSNRGQAATPLDEKALHDIKHMFNNVPILRISLEAFLSMTLCAPFSFTIPKLNMVSSPEMGILIERYWMPWLRKVWIWIKMIGICPYYFERPHKNSNHQVPVVPDIDMVRISVSVSKKHKVKYHLSWMGTLKADYKIFWVRSEHSPSVDGTIRSPMATLLPQYRTLMVLQQSLEKISAQNAEPSHILEYHPSSAHLTAENDHLTQEVAKFGSKAAGLSQARRNASRNQQLRVRTAELIQMTNEVHAANTISRMSAIEQASLLQTDSMQSKLDRSGAGFVDRLLPLPPDYKVSSIQRPQVAADLEKHLASFNLSAAAIMDFAMEMLNPTSYARTNAVKGSERYENERIKQTINFFRAVAHAGIIVAYRYEFERGFSEVREQEISHPRGGDASDIAQLYPEIDVEIDMPCTPMMTYQELRQMWADRIMDTRTFALHAFRMNALPEDEIVVEKKMAPDAVSLETFKKLIPQAAAPPKKRERPKEEKAKEEKKEKPKKKKAKGTEKEDEKPKRKKAEEADEGEKK